MTIDRIRDITCSFISEYSIKSIILFGSRAEGTNSENSDVDLIVEFFIPVSLITLSKLKIDLEEALKLDVDIIHGPVTDENMIEVNKEIVLYAA